MSLPHHFLDNVDDSLSAWCAEQGAPAYRARQIRHWIFEKRATSFDDMRDLPLALRSHLEQQFRLFEGQVVRHQISLDGTEKLLVELHDGEHLECVLMREPRRRTVCISTQVGCAMGCVFCASGLRGVKRNLTTGEILEQVLRLDRLLAPQERITNVVIMGMGEPLANLKNLLPALDILQGRDGLGLGARRITVSTVGLPDGIRKLAAHGKPYNLAVSLHAPNDRLRNQIVPINEKIGLDAILLAADEYFESTGRRVTYEYVLLKGRNDSDACARELGALLTGRRAHLNLIPMNPVAPLHLAPPSAVDTARFADILRNAGVVVTTRKRKGADIEAACGQLRWQVEAQNTAKPVLALQGDAMHSSAVDNESFRQKSPSRT